MRLQMRIFYFMVFTACACAQAFAMSAAVCRVDCTSAKITAVSDGDVSIKLTNLDTGKPVDTKSMYVQKRRTSPKTSAIELGELMPSTRYAFTLANDAGESVAGSFKTSPDYLERTPPPDFSFVVFGHNYFNDKPFDVPFKTEGGEYEIFARAKSTGADFAVWAGGLDTFRNADKASRPAMILRYKKAAENTEAKKVLLNMPNYAAMSGFSFGGLEADSLEPSAQSAIGAFKTFWQPDAFRRASYYTFSYSDVQFFVLDVCSERSNLDFGESTPQILGQQQLKWLMTNLKASTAKFKIIVSGMPIANPIKDASNFTFAEKERKSLLQFLTLNKIEGLLFISANKDYSEITRLVRAGAYPLVEASAGATTARPAKEANQTNYFRVPSSLVQARNFLLVKVSGAENDRRISISIITSENKNAFSLELKTSQLRGE